MNSMALRQVLQGYAMASLMRNQVGPWQVAQTAGQAPLQAEQAEPGTSNAAKLAAMLAIQQAVDHPAPSVPR